MNLMLVEDNQSDIEAFVSSHELHPKMSEIEYIIARSDTEALSKISGSFDALIVDLSLNGIPDAGSRFLTKLLEMRLRVPIVVLTGTPDACPDNYPIVKKYMKGEKSYSDILDELIGIKNSGLTNILGGQGKIEELLLRFFENVIRSGLEVWVARGSVDPSRSEHSMLRFAASHILNSVYLDSEVAFPEEFYLYTDSSQQQITTGSILRRKNDGSEYLVMNPQCDLVLRADGSTNAERLLLVKINRFASELDAVIESSMRVDKKIDQLQRIARNASTQTKHYLPGSYLYAGGFADFKDFVVQDIGQMGAVFDSLPVQVSGQFVREILYRFSSYWGRQGQPEIEVRHLLET